MSPEERAHAKSILVQAGLSTESDRALDCLVRAFRNTHAAGKAEGVREEQEACAKVAERHRLKRDGLTVPAMAMDETAKLIARDIRARAEKENDGDK